MLSLKSKTQGIHFPYKVNRAGWLFEKILQPLKLHDSRPVKELIHELRDNGTKVSLDQKVLDHIQNLSKKPNLCIYACDDQFLPVYHIIECGKTARWALVRLKVSQPFSRSRDDVLYDQFLKVFKSDVNKKRLKDLDLPMKHRTYYG